ncbi:MAG TPA: glycosyltransferase family 39 protein [Gaiellaceae bacterium]|nr:glycosyltransferase family 39 protein [Gaiellaceae bacterium]
MATRTAPARSTAIGLVRAVPIWFWVGALVVASAGLRYALARRIVAPWIMVDELIYSELAKSFADTGRFLLRGESTAAYGFVYPALISPAWALFDRIPQAYAAAKLINSVVVSLAAVPAYLLARRVLSRPYALAAAMLSMSVPTLLFAGMLMTENAFYPAFLLAALATVLWLERPDWRRTGFVLAATVLAFLTRAQAIAILPALATAPFLVSGRRALREFRWFFAAGVAGVVLVVAVQLARNASVFGIFGAYEVAGHAGYTAGGVSRWLLYHWEELILSLGVVPFAALGVLALTGRGRPRPERAFLAAAVTLSFWLVLEVATFASEQSLRVEERNMFYVAPLFLIALLLWVERGSPRPRVPAAVAAAAAVALPTALPYTKLIGLPAVSDTTALLPLWSLSSSTGIAIGDLRWVVLGGAAAACALFLLVPRRFALVLPLLVLAYFAVSQKPIEGKYRQTSILDLFQGITAPQPDWVDRAVGRDAEVTLIWSGNTDKYSVWENEFFNRSVRRFYFTTTPLQGDLPEQPLTVDRGGFMRGPDGEVVSSEYVLTDGSVDVGGRPVAEDARKGIVLVRTAGELRQVSRVAGLYPQDTWSGARVTYTRLGCQGGTVVVSLQSDPSLFTRPTTVVASVGGREVARTRVGPTETRALSVPVRPSGSSCVVEFRVSPTLVPAKATEGQNPDPRELGIHFTRFTYIP